MLKIALVKQEIYQDLYVAPPFTKDAKLLLFSSIMRVGPIGLFYELNTDFIIVKEELEKETQFYKNVLPDKYSKHLYLLKENLANKIPGLEKLKPGSPFPNGKFAVPAEEIDWGMYDIVISINISIPTRIVKKFKNTLFCYMNGEGSFSTFFAEYGYDVTLNQLARGKRNKFFKNLDFPYTFLKGNTIYNLIGEKPVKNGLFIEKNSLDDMGRDFSIDNFFKSILDEFNLKMLAHEEDIEKNLHKLIKSKYYIKLGGRKIRGNGAIEAISSGALVLINRKDIIHKEICIPQLDFKDLDELRELILKLESNPDYYEQLKIKQQKIVTRLFFEKPLFNLIKFLDEKRSKNFRKLF